MVTKTKDEVKVTPTQSAGELVPQQGGPVASFVADMEQDSALGRLQMGIGDVALPYIMILQALSPQVSRSNPKHIDGAAEGMFYNSLTEEIFDPNEGIYIIPCAYQKAWVEWKPRDTGGGLVQSHDSDEILKHTTRNDRNFDVLPNGNFIIATAYYYCLMSLPDGTVSPVVISMARTQLKKSRRWNSMMLGIMVDGRNGKFNPPMFSHIYKMKTIPETKNNNSWFSWDIHLWKMIDDPHLYNMAKKLSADVSKGLVKAAPPQEVDGADDEPF